jgi:hypothetical protein
VAEAKVPLIPAIPEQEGNIDDWPTQSITDVVLAPTMAELHQALEAESASRQGTPAATEPTRAPEAARAPEEALGSQRVWLVPSPDGPRVVSGQRPRPEGAVEAILVTTGSIEGWLR